MRLGIATRSEETMPQYHGLARNTIFNFCGQAIILLIALFSIPLLIRSMGTQRFGVLALIWSFIGYFSLFDLGLGRALTTLVARSLTKEQTNIPSLIWTGLTLLIFLGFAGALSIFASASWLVRDGLNMPSELQNESLTALHLIAAIFPFVITQAGFRGVLEGLQRFDIVNGVNVAFGIFSFAGSLLALQFSSHLGILAGVVIVGRLLSWIISLRFCFKLIPNLGFWKVPDLVAAKRLLSFGGWMTVSNVIGPLMVYLDRFLIGALLSVTAVAYYTTPYDVVTRLWIIPSALVSALFPLFSALHASNPSAAKRFFTIGIKYIYIVLFPLTLMITAFAKEGLTFWLDEIFAIQSAVVLQWLAAGVLINSLAHVPFALIQSAGRPDLTAKLHLMELPIYLVCVLFLIKYFGIKGAAIAWTIRVSADSIFLFFLAWRLFLQKAAISIPFIFAIIISLGVLLIVSQMVHPIMKVWACLFILPAFFAGSSRYLLTSDDRLNFKSAFSELQKLFGKRT
jgi:O-antigen/teichoic acid export membrane protein